MKQDDDAEKVARFEAALSQFIERIAEDRYVLAIVLVGSLSTETIWHRESLGLWIIEADGVSRRLPSDGNDERIYRILVENDVNIHAEVISRSRFKMMVEGASRTAFSHNFFAERRMVFSKDKSIESWFKKANSLATKDQERELLTFSTWTIHAHRHARKRLDLKGDLELAAQDIFGAARHVSAYNHGFRGRARPPTVHGARRCRGRARRRCGCPPGRHYSRHEWNAGHRADVERRSKPIEPPGRYRPASVARRGRRPRGDSELAAPIIIHDAGCSAGQGPENAAKAPDSRGCGMGLGRSLAVLLCGLVLAGCATTPPTPEMVANNDPYEPTNREMLALNGKIDRYFVVPTVAVYFVLVPDPGRRAVHRFLENLTLPTTLVNDLLEGQVTRGGQTAARFVINTTIGFGGFLDPASRMKIPDHGADFGLTLGSWGVDEGPYMVLPFLGPSNPRDAVGLAADVGLDPTNYIPFKQHIWWSAGRYYFTVLDLRGQTFQTVRTIQRSSIDYYSALRSFYRQLRANAVRAVRSQQKKPQDLPDF